MGFNKKFLGTLKELQEEYVDRGHSEFIKIYSKADALIGPVNSMKFLDKVFKEIEYSPKKIKKPS